MKLVFQPLRIARVGGGYEIGGGGGCDIGGTPVNRSSSPGPLRRQLADMADQSGSAHWGESGVTSPGRAQSQERIAPLFRQGERPRSAMTKGAVSQIARGAGAQAARAMAKSPSALIP